jgi:putative hydrolase of the HAD superfamily
MSNYKDIFLNVKHISFDLDNTLYDESIYFKSAIDDISKFLESHEQINKKKIELFLWSTLRTNGLHYHHLFDDLLEQFKLDSNYFLKIMEIFKSTTPALDFFKGTPEMLKKLKKSFGLSIITSGQKENQENKIKLLNAKKYFDLIIFSSTLKEDKPSSIPFQHLLNLTKLESQDIIYVGDNPMMDFKGANDLGIFTIGIKNNLLKNKKIENDFKPKIEIKNLLELQKYLKYD